MQEVAWIIAWIQNRMPAHRPYTASLLNKSILFCRTKMTFKDLGTEDIGIYTCDVTDTDGIASSYLIDEDGKLKMNPQVYAALIDSLMILWDQRIPDFCFSSLIALVFSLQS